MTPGLPLVGPTLLERLALPIACAVALLGLAMAGWQWFEAQDARGKLQAEIAARALEKAARTDVALRDTVRVANATGQHAADQQRNTHALNEEKRSVAAAGAGRRAGVERVRVTVAQLEPAGDQREAGADTASCRDQADRNLALRELLREGGRLLVEAGELAAEGAELLGRREAEIRAVMAQIEADRALMYRAAGIDPDQALR